MAKGKAKPAANRPNSAVTRVRKATRLGKRRYVKQTTRKYTPLPGSFKLVGDSFRVMRKHWKVLGGIVIVYLILNIILVGALSHIGTTVDDIKLNLEAAGSKQFADGFAALGVLIGSSGASGSSTAALLQLILVIVESLVIIWALRQLLAGHIIKVKQAYYSSTAPLIPFLLVLVMFVIQLLPLTIGSVLIAAITSAVLTGGGATAVMITLISLLAAWSFYMLSGSIFAMYIVTLPDMTPRKALRSAKNLVRFRRWSVIRKGLFLPLFLLILYTIIIVPLILYGDWFVAPVFFVMSMLSLLFVHTYMYNLYRGLLE